MQKVKREKPVTVKELVNITLKSFQSAQDHVNVRFDAVDKRFDAVDKKFEALMEKMDKGFDELKTEIRTANTATSKRLERVETVLNLKQA